MANQNSPIKDAAPKPPRLRPTWTTWMWLGFAIIVAVLTVVGMMRASGSSAP